MKRIRCFGLGLTACVLAVAASAFARLPQQDGVTTIAQADVRLSGLTSGVEDIAPAGDINGDGFGDVMIGNPIASPRSRVSAGQVTIVLGGPDRGALSTSTPGRTITIDGPAPGAFAGNALARAGDVNGDGRDDLIVGSYFAPPAGTGSAFVIFGQPAPVSIDLASLGTAGFRIDGGIANDQLGYSVAGVGDVNLDGLADVAVGGIGVDNGASDAAGAVFVVFGRTATTPVSIVNIPSAGAPGFRIDTVVPGQLLGTGVAPVGDVNGDGRPDLAVSARQASPMSRGSAGATYVVFGPATNTTINVAAITPTQGYTIAGAAPDDLSGTTLASAGDVNRDGRRDLIIGAIGADNNSRASSGSAYVVFGPASPANVDLSNLGNAGFRIDGAGASHRIGQDVAGVGDVNGDGVDDVAISAQQQADAGYVVFGKADGSTVDVAALGNAGFTIGGSFPGIEVRWPIGGAADFNGDGRADVVAVEHNNLNTDPAEVGIVYGYGAPAFTYPAEAADIVVDEDVPFAPLSAVITGRTGAPVFSVTPALPSGLVLNPATGAITGAPTAGAPMTAYTVSMTDLSASVTQSIRLQVRDRTAPVVRLGGSLRQRVVATRRLTTTIRCDEACTTVASATLLLPGGKTLRLGVKRPTLVGGRTTTLRFVLTSAARSRLARLLRSRPSATIRLSVVATDLSGNRAAAKRRVFRVVR